jgi:hypothetical protein
MSRGDALLIVVLTRIWQVAIDAAFLGIAALIYRIRRQYYNQVISQLSAE